MSVYSRAKTRQRLARAIEHSYPRELSAFIDYIAASHGASTQHTLHARALEYARIHYSDADFIAAGNAEPEE